MPMEVMETGAKLSANTNDELFMNKQGDGKKEAGKCLIGASEMPPEDTNSNVNQNSKHCTKGETDHPSAEGGEHTKIANAVPEVIEAILDVESSPVSLKRRKISTEPDTVDDNILELEKVAERIRRLQNLLLSVGSAPSSVAKSSWKFLDKEASTKEK